MFTSDVLLKEECLFSLVAKSLLKNQLTDASCRFDETINRLQKKDSCWLLVEMD